MKSEQIIYQEIKDILWSIIPPKESKIAFRGYIYDSPNQLGCHKILDDGQMELIEIPSGILLQLMYLMKGLQKCEIFSQKPWTHFKIIFLKNKMFEVDFAYIPKEDSWVNLIMKGISDLTEEEWKNTGIPKELWEERVFYKDSGQLGKLQSYFINKERREEFSNLTDDQYIYQQIAELLRSIAPSNQCNLVLSGYVKNQLSQLDFHQVMDNGQTLHIDMSSDELLTLLQLLEDLQNCEIFAKEPWTHFHITLDKDDKFKMGFSYEN